MILIEHQSQLSNSLGGELTTAKPENDMNRDLDRNASQPILAVCSRAPKSGLGTPHRQLQSE